MKKYLAIIILLTGFLASNKTSGQVFDPFIQSMVGQVSFDTLYQNLSVLESFGRKQITDPALETTAQWLMAKYTGFGYADIQTDPFTLYNYPTYNIIVTKTGTEFPDTFVIIDGHYDTKTGPGVNDNGSGVAIILEIARLLHNISTRYSIKFINFSAEEYGMIGSGHYVENVVIPEEMDIRIVFNIDEVGGVAGMVNNVVVCERDESAPTYNNQESWAFTDTLVALTEIYSSLQPVISYAYGSDYVPFQSNGEIITGIFEDNYSPWAHTVHDSLCNLDMDYVFEMAKISVAAGMYYAGAYDTVTGIPGRLIEDSAIKVFPNPFSGRINVTNNLNEDVQLLLMNGTGFCIYKSEWFNGTYHTIFTGTLQSGLYFYQLINKQGVILQTGKIVGL
jgi:hypothetical protein